jgi:16S rRNA (uracil1498-N3)-methyltransferase
LASGDDATIGVRAAAAAQVFSSDLDQLKLSTEDLHHLSRVLRLHAGEEVIVADGAGSWRRTVWADGAVLPVTDRQGPGGDGQPALTVAFAPTKGERPEWVVQKLTELGIDRIVPLMSERSVVRWTGERGRSAVERLRRVAREAAGQCRRVWLPEITEVTEFAALASLGQGGAVVLAQLSGDRPDVSQHVVAVGPEGGWSEAELAAGLPTVGFGLSVLRAETAAVTAGALMTSLRTGTVAAVGKSS